jgi:hypothetical protein
LTAPIHSESGDHRLEIALDAEAWQGLCDILDRPTQAPDGLEDLFAKPSVFEPHPAPTKDAQKARSEKTLQRY